MPEIFACGCHAGLTELGTPCPECGALDSKKFLSVKFIHALLGPPVVSKYLLPLNQCSTILPTLVLYEGSSCGLLLGEERGPIRGPFAFQRTVRKLKNCAPRRRQYGGLRFKPAIVLALPSNLALLRKDAGLKCGLYMLLCPLAIRAKKVA